MGLKIISGGQTGVDQIALYVAKKLGIETGGTMPLGFLTEAGHHPSLAKTYGMVANNSSDYPTRTVQNIIDSDCTLLFGDTSSKGSVLAINSCAGQGRPCYENPTPDTIKLLIGGGYKTFNIAGNRGSKLTEATSRRIASIIKEGFKQD